MSHFVSASCSSEHCNRCFRVSGQKVPASHKIEESILFDDPLPERHPLTSYLCCECFTEVVGDCQALLASALLASAASSDDSPKKILPIVAPGSGAGKQIQALFAGMTSGSVAVLWESPSGAFWVYFEGGIYTRFNRPPTSEERHSYAIHAADRAVNNYPTVARAKIEPERVSELKEIGRVIYGPPTTVEFFTGEDGGKKED